MIPQLADQRLPVPENLSFMSFLQRLAGTNIEVYATCGALQEKLAQMLCVLVSR
jgi:hypothetical protein